MDTAKSINVLFLAAEASPFNKIGGLGDVAGSLPQAIRSLPPVQSFCDHLIQADIRLVLPLHGDIQIDSYPLRLLSNFHLPYKGTAIKVTVYTMEFNDMPVYFVSGEFIQPESAVYSSDIYTDGRKYTFFSQAVLEFIRKIDWKPHILHANDWHTSAVIYGLAIRKEIDDFYKDIFSVLSIHNLAYMGTGSGKALSDFGLPVPTRSELPQWARVVPLALGISSADKIVAVSPSYAEEIQTPEYGENLNEYLFSRRGSISGILNGIDYSRWDPETDTNLAYRFGLRNLYTRIKNKIELQREVGFVENPEIPLIGMVTRMAFQKGFDLVPEALKLLRSSDENHNSWQLVVLGKGEQDMEQLALHLQKQFPINVKVAIRYDERLSHRIYGGADMLLMPSRYEPCGLTQMIGMRYGCIPVARATGGLKDTIIDYSNKDNSTGFLFGSPAPKELAKTLGRAINAYSDKTSWETLQRRAMQMDFSWNRSATEYLKLYWELIVNTEGINWN